MKFEMSLDKKLIVILIFFSSNNNHKEEGIQIMTEALNADPYNLDVLMSLADMMVDVENWSEAERYYQAVMQEKPDFANAYNNFGAFLFKRGTFFT